MSHDSYGIGHNVSLSHGRTHDGCGFTRWSASGFTRWSASGFTRWSASGFTRWSASGFTRWSASGFTRWSASGFPSWFRSGFDWWWPSGGSHPSANLACPGHVSRDFGWHLKCKCINAEIGADRICYTYEVLLMGTVYVYATLNVKASCAIIEIGSPSQCMQTQ